MTQIKITTANGSFNTTTGELKQLIASKLDVIEFLDIIGWTMFDLVEKLEEEIEENYDELLRACEEV